MSFMLVWWFVIRFVEFLVFCWVVVVRKFVLKGLVVVNVWRFFLVCI